jgi:hypothetical protein
MACVPPRRRDLRVGVQRAHAATRERRTAVDAGDVREIQDVAGTGRTTMSDVEVPLVSRSDRGH